MQIKEESNANGTNEPEEALPAAVKEEAFAPEEVKEEAVPKRAQRARGRGRNARL